MISIIIAFSPPIYLFLTLPLAVFHSHYSAQLLLLAQVTRNLLIAKFKDSFSGLISLTSLAYMLSFFLS